MLVLSQPAFAAATRQLPRTSAGFMVAGMGAEMLRCQRSMSTSVRRYAPAPSTQRATPAMPLSDVASSSSAAASTSSSQHSAQGPTSATASTSAVDSVDSRDVILGERHPSKSYLLFHPVYSESDLDSVKVVHRQAKTMGDRVAGRMVWLARSVFDMATRYPGYTSKKFPPMKSEEGKKVDPPSHTLLQRDRRNSTAGEEKKKASSTDVAETEGAMTLAEMRKKGICFGPDAWLNRFIFLESIAGVPGMVAASCRHLQSLRLMKRDNGWIHTMLEDAENERMHLLTFMAIAKPGIIARTFALLAQGVFYNAFFVFYLLAPRVAHRFVGVLEEEAVHTYTLVLEDMKAGRLPEWDHLPAPEIAIDYWQLPKDARFVDVIRAVRADEATHRCINHTMASIQSTDPNPFAYRDAPAKLRGETYGLEREEALEWASKSDEKALHKAESTA